MFSAATHRFRALMAALALTLVAASCSSEPAISDGVLQAPEQQSSNTADADLPAASAAASAVNSAQAVERTDAIDGLVELCVSGSDMACDTLFHYTDHSSDAEAVALDCGGRGGIENSFCTTGVVADEPNRWFAVDSPALQGVVAACEDGDMIACDFLFVRSPAGSRFERIGLSCGGRTSVANPDCHRALK